MAKEARELLETWFGALKDRWFERDDALDAELRARYGEALDRAARGLLGGWCATAKGALAFVILCDQIARNAHRGTARAFATDALALHQSLAILSRGEEQSFTREELGFLLMPLMHSEDLEMHDRLEREIARHHRDDMLPYARKHRQILELFGRYPHRNESLGRASTAEELAFLQDPENRF
jgi:uncharacterized protein (DUF924 family)